MPYFNKSKKNEIRPEKSKAEVGGVLFDDSAIYENIDHNMEPQTGDSVATFPDNSDEVVGGDLAALRARLQATIGDYLPEFYEFQQTGRNILYPKPVDIKALQARLNSMPITAWIQPLQQQLEQAGNAFLDRFRLFRKEKDWHNNALEFVKFRLAVKETGWDEQQTRDYNEALKHANRLSGYLSGTLDLIQHLNDNPERQTSWEAVRKTSYDMLLNELLPVDAENNGNQYTAKIRGNLTKNHPDNIKFNTIVNSVTRDERMASEALSAETKGLSARLLSGIALTRNSAEKIDKKSETSGITRDIVALCQVLQGVIKTIKRRGEYIQPLTDWQPSEHKLPGQKEELTKAETVKRELVKSRKVMMQKVQGAKTILGVLSDKTNKNRHRITQTLPYSANPDTNTVSRKTNEAVFRAGIMLLDKIQQTTSGIHKASLASRPLQHAVTQYSALEQMSSGMPSNRILDAKLRSESGRWQEKAEESKKQLQHILREITALAEEHLKHKFMSALRDELKRAPETPASNNIISNFDTRAKIVVEGLASIEIGMNQSVVRLAGHGEAGRKDLDEQVVAWLQRLERIKGELKTDITQATGQSNNNFSRQGMLARRMGEWNEAEKQRYLAALSTEDRAVAEMQYNTLFFEVIQHYLPLLSKETDPQGERLLQRLRLEVSNAAEGTTVYPATMAEILAGMKSTEQAIRDWSGRKLLRVVFLAACLEGVKLMPKLAALPLRVAIKFVITGAKVAWATHKGQQGIHGGEGDVDDEIGEYAKRSFKTASVKVVLSLPPGLATMLGVASIALDVYEGGLKGAGGRIAKNIVGEAPWRALNQGSKIAAEAYTTASMNAALKEGGADLVSHSSTLQQQMDAKPFSDNSDQDADQPRVRRKREMTDEIMLSDGSSRSEAKALPDENELDTDQSKSRPESALAVETLQSEHFDFDRGIRYQDFSDEQKKQTYLHGIKFVLLQIENDGHFAQHIRNNAYLARIGAKLAVPVDIYRYKLNNTFLLPDEIDSKSGVLIRLDSEIPYYYVSEGKDLLENIAWAMPYNAANRGPLKFSLDPGEVTSSHSGVDILNNIRSERFKFETYFNYNAPEAMSIESLSAQLANTIEADYKFKNTSPTNKILISRAIVGAHIPDPGVRATQGEYHIEFDSDELAPAKYLRSFARPFSTLSGEMQLISSSIKGETIQETELHVHQAEYIGSWVDATAGAIISFTPEGWFLNTAQSAAEITADLTEGKDPDPLAVAGLLVGIIPGGKIAAKVGKFTRIGGKAVKYGLILGNKAVDLAIVGKSIKTAVDTGEPLAIYQAFLASGMSVKNSYDIAKNMSSELKISKKIEESARLRKLKALQKNTSKYSMNSKMPVRKFRVGQTDLLGKIHKGEIKISRNNGTTWEKGNQLHLLAYRLQNAGGGRLLPDVFRDKIVIGEYSFKRVKYNQKKLNEMMRIAKMYTPTSNSTERIAKLQQNYKTGKEMSHAPQYDTYNDLSLGEKLDLFINSNTDATTRGVLAGKINESITNINLYETAKGVDAWKTSANKATDVVLAPQNIFLKGRAGECLPESILMGWALQSGQDTKLAKKLMNIHSSSNIAANPLYKSLVELHSDGNASRFGESVISDINMKMLSGAESKLFPTENSSVRVDIPEHTMLISKVNKDGKIKYVFYDPNYGMAYFNKYKEMISFFKKKIKGYDTPKRSTSFRQLDYSHLSDIKIKGKNLNEIIDGEIPQIFRQEDVNLEGVTPQDGIYRMLGTHQQENNTYIKSQNNIYQVEWDQTTNAWRVFDSANTNRSRITVPIKRDTDGEWFKYTETGLKGGGLFDEIKNNWLQRKRFKNLQDFNDIVDFEENKWPSEAINKDIHMIWIGTRNISEKNIGLSLETARKNSDYNTTIIYDSRIAGYESAKDFMTEKFKDSKVTLVDFRKKSYFHQLQQEPSFPYYEQAIRDKKYAQASDILRLLVLKYEGGIYKDIDDVQVKAFGSLAFPKGIGVMREYAPEAGKTTAFPNTPIAATKNNPVVNKTLELAVENYHRGETNVLKLAGPDVFTESLYQEIPGMRPQVLGAQLDQFELAKRQALGMRLEKPKGFADEKLTLQEKAKIRQPYEAIRGLSGYVDNGADHSWVTDMPGNSTQSSGLS
ncbi:hypothetical protein ND446_01530 [Yersinia ruckeri]|uniref:glycosyltransferase n=2 Tax=Yersinia ruckeri TaxID=29486 RepID=UPI0022641DA1|nr:glycosyltransferase [Yersinia ruckeri]UZX55639.1 hypothetical protein ND446_01530 [Yersinia ruckeri]